METSKIPRPLPAEGQDPCTPGGVVAGSGALARGLGQPAYRGATYRATVIAGVALALILCVLLGVLFVS